jgi:hypothetical protein
MQKTRKIMVLQICRLSPKQNGFTKCKSTKSQKRFGPQMTKSANCHICGRSKNLTNLVRKCADLQFADFFADWPPKLTGTPDKLAGF